MFKINPYEQQLPVKPGFHIIARSHRESQRVARSATNCDSLRLLAIIWKPGFTLNMEATTLPGGGGDLSALQHKFK